MARPHGPRPPAAERLLRAAWITVAAAAVQAVAGLVLGLDADGRAPESGARLFFTAPATFAVAVVLAAAAAVAGRGRAMPRGRRGDALIIAGIAFGTIVAMGAVLLWIVSGAD
ncbi:MAG: hypothetical protein KDC33_08405 [Thermoleophilia bacterium]|nr:hypothetical protein [Thermoleophilia bacterium]